MRSNRGLATAGAVYAIVMVAAVPAAAAPRHHRHDMMRAPQATAPARQPYSFYPNEIEGGVSGNLPFNNQIRKMKDPLNANGAGR